MQEQYNHFVKYHVRLARISFDKLHEMYKRKNILYDIISSHRDYLFFIGFPYSKIEALHNGVETEFFSFDYNQFDEDVKYLTLRANISNYIYLCTTTIPNLINAINEHSFLAVIDYRTFIDFYKSLNMEITKKLLLGRAYEFPYRVGTLKIVRFKRNFNRKVVNWGESNKLKKTNPDKYIVYHLDDEYLAPKFDKSNSRIPNYKYYKFKFTSFINTKDRSQKKYYEEINSFDEIVYDKRVGNIEKMIAVTKLDGNNKRFDTHDI